MSAGSEERDAELFTPEVQARWRERVKHGTAPNGVLVMLDEIDRLLAENAEWKLEAERRGLPKELMQRLHRAEAENARLREYETLIRDAGVAFEDARLDYIEIQVDRDEYLRLYDALSSARADSAAEISPEGRP
jgi:hypothetical protein